MCLLNSILFGFSELTGTHVLVGAAASVLETTLANVRWVLASF